MSIEFNLASNVAESDIDDVRGSIDSEGFWHALTEGYIDIELLLPQGKQKDKLFEAIKVIKSFENFLEEVTDD